MRVRILRCCLGGSDSKSLKTSSAFYVDMSDEFLQNARVRVVLLELAWGDRFESDLETKIKGVSGGLSFEEIRDGLLERDFVYRLRGGRGSYYLALTDSGMMVAGQLQETTDR
jgi:hypothetical protein